ncbi:hypothetical protein [Limnoglobus roseus]|uniref:BON domain-containing protein n=1 Tax=Limnoglobus roseus TaxID=2598579 RepID=A0A5C1ADL2_9BACT|nr:hypothetical protein [Limnoglobus roseus]QEL16725.1 hypothetical protein PX52LOC_03691 [Limnoglobus roseus]
MSPSTRLPYSSALVNRPETGFELLHRAVEARAGRQFRGLRIEAVAGLGYVLHGLATSYYAKQLAQHVVGLLTGQTILANRIEVCPPDGAVNR